MKIDRLIGIITTLQQKKHVTAPYLAEKFEVWLTQSLKKQITYKFGYSNMRRILRDV